MRILVLRGDSSYVGWLTCMRNGRPATVVRIRTLRELIHELLANQSSPPIVFLDSEVWLYDKQGELYPANTRVHRLLRRYKDKCRPYVVEQLGVEHPDIVALREKHPYLGFICARPDLFYPQVSAEFGLHR